MLAQRFLRVGSRSSARVAARQGAAPVLRAVSARSSCAASAPPAMRFSSAAAAAMAVRTRPHAVRYALAQTGQDGGAGESGVPSGSPPAAPPQQQQQPKRRTEKSWAEQESEYRNWTPVQFKAELDKYIVGQDAAKRAVSIAMRNRWRRKHLPKELSSEVAPKNILMVGPTGCGKSEIARRLAKVTGAPFLKVEATKYTEVGFHGKDVDTIAKELVDVAVHNAINRRKSQLKKQMEEIIENMIVAALVGSHADQATMDSLREQLRSGQLENNRIEIEVLSRDSAQDSGISSSIGDAAFVALASRARSEKRKERKNVTVKEARKLLEESEMDKMISQEEIIAEAIQDAQENGIVVIDEIDKIVRQPGRLSSSADASDEGVQRDLLPMLEGSTYPCKGGTCNTEHILFICAGAFHTCKPSDMISELLGRLPIRVELQPLKKEDLRRILTQTENNLIKQQIAMMATEDVKLEFTDDAIEEIARVSEELNTTLDNIGARRLFTVMEKIMSDISFDAPSTPGKHIIIDTDHVRKTVQELRQKQDLSKFII